MVDEPGIRRRIKDGIHAPVAVLAHPDPEFLDRRAVPPGTILRSPSQPVEAHPGTAAETGLDAGDAQGLARDREFALPDLAGFWIAKATDLAALVADLGIKLDAASLAQG